MPSFLSMQEVGFAVLPTVGLEETEEGRRVQVDGARVEQGLGCGLIGGGGGGGGGRGGGRGRRWVG